MHDAEVSLALVGAMDAMSRFISWTILEMDLRTGSYAALRNAIRETARSQRRLSIAHVAWSRDGEVAKVEILAACVSFVGLVEQFTRPYI